MDFEPSEEQAMLREVSRSMLTTHCPPELVRATADAGHDLDDKLWARGAELGWTLLAVPEDQGGAGMGLVELCLVAEEVGRAAAPGPWLDTALTAMVAARGGAPAEIVEGLSDGSLKAAVVTTEDASLVQAAGSVDWLLVVTADSVGLAEVDHAFVLRRRTLDETRSFYAVDLGSTPPTHTLDMDPQWVLDAAAILTAADALGIGERLLAMTVDYAKVREQFGRPIGSFQVVKHKAADMLKSLKGVRAATYYAAMALDAGLADASMAASVAKAFASEQVPAIAGEALQTHGGIGFTWEHDLHLYLRRAKADEALYGDTGYHHDRVATLSV
jgi:alkylation response protein AidB-like acyl-CoA dehydrogenase